MTLPDPATATWPRRTDRTTLRLLTRDDVDAMHAYRRLPEVCEHLTHDPLSRDEVALRIDWRLSGADPTRGRLLRGVAVVLGDRMVGDAMLRTQLGDDGLAELWIGYAFHPDVWGRGLATEVVRELCAVGGEMGLSVHADTYAENVASQRVLEKAGLSFVGTGDDDGRPVRLYATPGA